MSAEEKLSILKGFLTLSHISREECLFYCPYCEHHKPKLSVNFDKNVYKCWVCDSKGNSIWRLVRKFGDASDKRKWKSFEEKIDLTESLYDKIFGTPKPEEEKVELPKEFVSLTNRKLLVGGQRAKKYILNRGLTDRDIARWKIGYCPSGEYKNRVIFPSFNKDGKLNYFVGRSHSDDWMKYKNPMVSKDIIFNELNVDWKERVCLVEGIFDAVKAGINSIPLLGSTLNENSKLFQKIIENDTIVYLALDADADKKSGEMIKAFLSHGIEIHQVDVSGYEDVGAMSKEIFRKRFRQARQITSDVYLRDSIRKSGV